jgi:flagellar basal-body rod protein FlgB
MIVPSDDRNFSILENLLSWASKRQQALASNITNLDTPGYRAKDYSFEAELASQMISMTKTSPMHIAPVQETPSARIYEVGTKDKPNGKNVDIERELTEITKNGLEYITFVQYLNQKIRTLRSAISDGGKV